MASPPTATVTVRRRFSASAEQVFDAWLDPAMIGQWMFGPKLRDEEIVSLKVDAQVGGRFSFVVRREGKELDHVGKYLEIDRPRRLVFTWGDRGVLRRRDRRDGRDRPARRWLRADAHASQGLVRLRGTDPGRLDDDGRDAGQGVGQYLNEAPAADRNRTPLRACPAVEYAVPASHCWTSQRCRCLQWRRGYRPAGI